MAKDRAVILFFQWLTLLVNPFQITTTTTTALDMKFLCLLSPTKTLAEKSCKEFTSTSTSAIAALSKPRSILLERAKELKQSEIKSMMKLSDSLAKLNYDRYQSFADQPMYPAGWLFDGPSFQKLNIQDFSDEEL